MLVQKLASKAENFFTILIFAFFKHGFVYRFCRRHHRYTRNRCKYSRKIVAPGKRKAHACPEQKQADNPEGNSRAYRNIPYPCVESAQTRHFIVGRVGGRILFLYVLYLPALAFGRRGISITKLLFAHQFLPSLICLNIVQERLSWKCRALW